MSAFEPLAPEDRYRLQRRLQARGSHGHYRAHPAVDQPTLEELGALLARLTARCGACGQRAVGQFAQYERATVWESAGDRWPMSTVVAALFICPKHGRLRYQLEELEADLARARAHRDRVVCVKLRPGWPSPAEASARRAALAARRP